VVVSSLPKPPEQTHIRPPDRVSLWWCWLDQGAGETLAGLLHNLLNTSDCNTLWISKPETHTTPRGDILPGPHAVAHLVSGFVESAQHET
jgi:hypothetical protein